MSTTIAPSKSRSLLALDRAKELAEMLESSTETQRTTRIELKPEMCIEIADLLIEMATNNHNLRVQLTEIGGAAYRAAQSQCA